MKAIASFLLLSSLAIAMFMHGEKVPVERLMANVKAHFAAYLNKAEADYLLGRLESLAFSGEAESVEVMGPSDNEQLPHVPFWAWVQETSHAPVPLQTLSPRTRELFLSSIEHYRQAISLDSSQALYHFSLGWMAEQGQQFVSEIGSPADKITSWRMLAIREYQEASRLAPTPTTQGIGPLVAAQSRLALIGVLREEINDRSKVRGNQDAAFISDAKREIAANQSIVDGYKKLPLTITPLIFSTRPHARFADLLSLSQVSFDLGGFGEDRKWPWLRPDTAILVWDPTNEGHIRSGRQLFGSVTWWMFWKNGFEPLAALDDNADGWLTGNELGGIGVWQDRNGNGVSDPGEVVPAAQFGIVALAVHPEGKVDGVLAARNGVVTRGNSFTLYDWVPRADSSVLPTLSSRADSGQPLSSADRPVPRPGVR
jgi:hypothetical protein